MKRIQDGMKKNEIRVEHDTGYELGQGRVWVKLPDRTSFNPHDIRFERAGRVGTDTREVREAEVSTSSFSGSADDAIIWAKGLIRAAKEARKKVTMKEVEAKREKENTEYEAHQVAEALRKAAKDRRAMNWTKNTDGTYSEANGLFTIVPNNAPEWKEQSKRFLLLGPSYDSRDSYWYDKRDAHHERKEGDYWDEYKVEVAVRSLEEGQTKAQSELERMIEHSESIDYTSKDVPLLRERGKSGKVVMTDTMKLRMKKAPFQHRENKLPEQVKP